MLRKFLALPETKNLDLDDPRTTAARRRIIEEKAFLKAFYGEWYEIVSAALPPGRGTVLELGSGAGFAKMRIPSCITSEIIFCRFVDVILDGSCLPLRDHSLRAIIMIDVFHHLRKPRLFLAEAARCVEPGGRIVMIEPWVTAWAKFVYRHLHHEPFAPDSREWELPPAGPLSGANSALPWIVFQRDRDIFRSSFPEWVISEIRPLMPVSYLFSGGVSLRSLMPGSLYRFWRRVEKWVSPWNDKLAMFALIILDRHV
ncbi:MAG: methyltransferase domain-containing protein [Candidatus Aminicenantales bacterium]